VSTPSEPVSVEITTTEPGLVEISQTPPEGFSFSLIGPQGPKGDTGATGLTGPPGPGSLSALSDVNLSVAPTNGQALVYDAASSKWKASPGGALTTISQIKLSSAQATVDFTGIPGTFRDLIIEGKFRSTRPGQVKDNAFLRVGTGGVIDTAPDTYRVSLVAQNNGASGLDTALGATTWFKLAESACPAASADADCWGTMRIVIYDYADITSFRPVEATLSAHVSAGTIFRDILSGHWRNKTGPIDCLRLSVGTGNIVAGSTFRLYAR
jgi:hypothetical protein